MKYAVLYKHLWVTCAYLFKYTNFYILMIMLFQGKNNVGTFISGSSIILSCSSIKPVSQFACKILGYTPPLVLISLMYSWYRNLHLYFNDFICVYQSNVLLVQF